MIQLTGRDDRVVLLDEVEIGAIVEHASYCVIYLKHADHEIVVKDTAEDIAKKIIERRKIQEDEIRKSFVKDRATTTTTSDAWPTKITGPISRGLAAIADDSITADKIAEHDILSYWTDEGKP